MPPLGGTSSQNIVQTWLAEESTLAEMGETHTGYEV